MLDRTCAARHRVAVSLLALAAALPFAIMAAPTAAALQEEPKPEGLALTVPPFAPLFATPEDARAFWDMSLKAYSSPMPDARTLAKAFIRERLDIDGDAYTVFHFTTPGRRLAGGSVSGISLTDAVMAAFPEHSRYSFFGRLADTVDGLSGGGRASPGVLPFVRNLRACHGARQCLAQAGRFLWSRTWPGYVYNTFIAMGNVIETAEDDLRSLDEVFGVYPIASASSPATAAPFRFSRVLGAFEEEGLFSELPYVKQLKAKLDGYWEAGRSDWPLLARYRFIHLARGARASGVLTQDQYELVMKGGAPNVPLDGPITLQQLRSAPPAAPVRVRRFDINGYAASDILRFAAADASEIMYVPGAESPFVVFRGEGELRQWVVRQAGNPRTLDELLSHFSIYNSQDGVFWTGVAQGLTHLADAQWTPDSTTIDRSNALIAGDIFEDMRIQVEARSRDDAEMQITTAWDAWRLTLSRAAILSGPLGYAPPLAIPVQAGSGLIGLGTGMDRSINGRTSEERTFGLQQAVMTVVTSVAGSQFPPSRLAQVLRFPQRINDRIGYFMGPTRPPRVRAAGEPAESGQQAFELHSIDEGKERLGYIVQGLPLDAAARTRAIIDMKKLDIDEARHRLDDFRTDSLAINSLGFHRSLDQSVVYRVDDRSPAQLIANGGFGQSSHFNNIRPMLRQPATIGSGSLPANNIVFDTWSRVFTHGAQFNQYAVWTDGRSVAAASDNLHPRLYDFALDEVHFPADVSVNDIYIIDSLNPVFAEAIAKIYESKYVSTPYGVPLEAFTDYVAGRLDINAPNRFTPQRLTASFPTHASPSDGSGSTIEVGYQPLSSSETTASSANVPLIEPAGAEPEQERSSPDN